MTRQHVMIWIFGTALRHVSLYRCQGKVEAETHSAERQTRLSMRLYLANAAFRIKTIVLKISRILV